MYKLFCDKCHKEIQESVKTTLRVRSCDSKFEFHLCPECLPKFVAFMREPVEKVGDVDAGVVEESSNVSDVQEDDTPTQVEDDTPTQVEDDTSTLVEEDVHTQVEEELPKVVETTPDNKIKRKGKTPFHLTEEGAKFISDNMFTGDVKDAKGRYTWEVVQHIIRLKSNGASTTLIGKTCGLTYSTVYNMIVLHMRNADSILRGEFLSEYPMARPSKGTQVQKGGRRKEDTEDKEVIESVGRQGQPVSKIVDVGKIIALYRAGWTVVAIAGECGLSEDIVKETIMRRAKDER